MSIALYKLAAEFNEVATRLEELEMDEQTIHDTLESYAADFDDKAVAVGQFLLNLEATIAGIKEAEANMAARRKAYEKKVDYLRQYLINNMELVHREKIECGFFKMSLRTNPPSVQIQEGAVIPAEFVKQRVDLVTDKKALKAALESGAAIDGISLVRSTSLVIK